MNTLANTALAQKTVLVTRPVHQAQGLCQDIEAAGGMARLFPTIDVVPVDDPPILKWQSNIVSAQVVVFVSANAVLHAIPHIQAALEVSQPVILPIGPGTASALQRAHIRVSGMPLTYSSEGVLAWLSDQGLIHKTIMIVSGEHARPYLKAELRRLGADVHEILCYRRRCPPIDQATCQALQHQIIDGVVTTSLDGLRHLYHIFFDSRYWLCALNLVVISPSMYALAKQYGFHQILLAPSATDSAIVETLSNYFSSGVNGGR